MGKVYDSVQQILNECGSMLKETENCEFVDVNSLAKTLRSECSELKNLFDNDPGNEDSIRAKKQSVERLAIRLEYFMSVRLRLFQERQKLRKAAINLYTDCRQLVLALNAKNGVPSSELITWAINTQWALGFYARSCNIVFEVTEEDNKNIVGIINNMKVMKERYGV